MLPPQTSSTSEPAPALTYKQTIALVKAAVLESTRAYLKRASGGGMPIRDIKKVDAVLLDMLELQYLDCALAGMATDLAAALHENAFSLAYNALKSCESSTADGQTSMRFDESLVQAAIYELAVIRVRHQQEQGQRLSD